MNLFKRIFYKKNPDPESMSYLKAAFGTIGATLSCVLFLLLGVFEKAWVNLLLGGLGLVILIFSTILYIEGWYQVGQMSAKKKED
jgi:hypothetical protein